MKSFVLVDGETVEGPPVQIGQKCVTDSSVGAIGVLDTMLRNGIRVPDDLSLIGYDDARFGRIPEIDLTSVRQDIPKMAKPAVKAINDRLDRPTRKPKEVVLRPKLVVGTNTSTPRAPR